MDSLADKVVVITGGAGFIGRSFVRAVLEQGAIAVIAELDVDAGERIIADLPAALAMRAACLPLDITDENSVDALIAVLAEKYGHIDAVVNNAYPRNKNYGRRIEDVTYADFCENVDSHLGGYFLVMQRFAMYFQRQGHGNIVNMSSIYGVIAPRFDVYSETGMTMPVEYAAIKSAIIHLTKYFAQYYKNNQIRVNAISPGGILEGQAPEFLARYNNYAGSKGMLNPEDICGALVFLLSDMSCYVNGQNIVVDDGWTL